MKKIENQASDVTTIGNKVSGVKLLANKLSDVNLPENKYLVPTHRYLSELHQFLEVHDVVFRCGGALSIVAISAGL